MADRTGIKMSGVEQMQKRLQTLARRFPDAAERALYYRAERIMSRSKREFVPVDLGNLRNTGTVDKPERKGNTISVTLYYGGPAAPYALAVHEHFSQHSPRSWKGNRVVFHPAGRGPKYLERPMMEAVSTLARDIADDIDLSRLL